MKTYLVGGAVRDQLLGRPVRERDWVVVGGTAAQMRERGFQQVGRDFPVFLHPDTREEYALARTERRTGPGHGDFECHAAPDVTLEEDMARRDLTINAMAMGDDGALIDPHGGQADLHARRLRHVSPAFGEDPLRVFRVARFAARLPDFEVHEETLTRMTAMTPELAALSGERVWMELAKALAAPRPARFFEIVQAIGGTCWFGALALPATIALYRERDFEHRDHALAALGWANRHTAVDEVFKRLRAPRLIHRAALAVATHGRTLANPAVDSGTLLTALDGVAAFRQGQLAALVVHTVARCAEFQPAALLGLIAELRELRVDVEPGPAYGTALRQRRLAIIGRAQAKGPLAMRAPSADW